MRISRREFLRLMGITGAILGGLPEISLPSEWYDRLRGPKIETWKVSTCGQCPAGCSIKVRLIDGIPVKIVGNPVAPVNRGRICPMGHTGLELLYHPDRLRVPLSRVGEKGSMKWKEVSWDEAMRIVAGQLKSLREKKRKDAFCFIFGDRNTEMTGFAQAFTRSLGSNHFIPWKRPALNELGFWESFEGGKSLSFDLGRANYIITFGIDLLEEPPSPVFFNRLYGKLKEERVRTGVKMVHVSPRMSQAGINSTEWIRVRPGTMGILALGIAYVILRDRAYDRRFIEKHTRDFEGGEDNFYSLVTKNYYPDRVALITGVPSDTIIRLAREFASARAPIALAGGHGERTGTALLDQWAILSLNALSGSFEAEGLWKASPEVPWVPRDTEVFDPARGTFSFVKKTERRHVPAHWVAENFPDTIKEKGRSFDVCFIAQTDPLFHAQDKAGWEEFLTKVPLVVQFASLHDNTSPFADLILPVPTYLEGWDLSLPTKELTFSNVGLFQPIVDAYKGPRQLGDILLHLWKKSGVTYIGGKTPRTYKEHIQGRMKKLFEKSKGTPYFEEVSLEFLEELKKRGWQAYSFPTFSDFWRLLEEKGGWWEPGGTKGLSLSTREKFRFPSPGKLASLVKERNPSLYQEDKEKIETSPHTWLEGRIVLPKEEEFTLFPFTRLFNITGDGANQMLLQELFGVHHLVYWKTWVEIHPETARKLGVENDDLVELVSGKGSLTLPVRVLPTLYPDIVAVPFGMGHKAPVTFARGIGENPLDLVQKVEDPLSKIRSWLSTVVKIRAVKT